MLKRRARVETTDCGSEEQEQEDWGRGACGAGGVRSLLYSQRGAAWRVKRANSIEFSNPAS